MREHVFCLRKYKVFVLSYRLSYRLSYNCLIDCLIIVLYVLLDVLQGSHKSCSGMLEPAPRGSPRPRKVERDRTDRSSASRHLFQCEAHWLRKCNRGRMGRLCHRPAPVWYRKGVAWIALRYPRLFQLLYFRPRTCDRVVARQRVQVCSGFNSRSPAGCPPKICV